MKIYIPGDSAALSMGADNVAVAIAAEAAKRNIDIQIVRNGTRGALWLEPLVEVEINGKRIGFNNVTSDDAAAVLDGTHPSIGDVDAFDLLIRLQSIHALAAYQKFAVLGGLFKSHAGQRGLSTECSQLVFGTAVKPSQWRHIAQSRPQLVRA